MQGLQASAGASRNARRRIHQRAQESGDIVTRLLHDSLFILSSLWHQSNKVDWVAAVENADLEAQTTNGSSIDLFHVHTIVKTDHDTASRIKDFEDMMSCATRMIGRAQAIRCGPRGKSGSYLSHYISKPDKTADRIVEQAFPESSSRIFCSAQESPRSSRRVHAASWTFSGQHISTIDRFRLRNVN